MYINCSCCYYPVILDVNLFLYLHGEICGCRCENGVGLLVEELCDPCSDKKKKIVESLLVTLEPQWIYWSEMPSDWKMGVTGTIVFF